VNRDQIDVTDRPREATLRQDRHITLIHLRNRCVSAVDTTRTPVIRNNRITDQTVHKLRQSGLCSRHPLKGMELKRLHLIASLRNFKLNLDSSENKMFCQVCRLHRRRARAH
jgi:hypothetical protein